MISVWGRKTSSNVQALMWCLGELGLKYERHDAGHRFGGLDSTEFGSMNPNRTIPVLQDGSNPPLWETGAILRYIATRYGTPEFWPKDLLARTEVDRWAEWAKLNVALAFTGPVFWQLVRTREPDEASIRNAVDALEAKLSIANDRLQRQDFLAGGNFTLADIQFGHVLFRYYDIDINRRDLEALAAYYRRLCARPAYAEHVLVSYDELKVR